MINTFVKTIANIGGNPDQSAIADLQDRFFGGHSQQNVPDLDLAPQVQQTDNTEKITTPSTSPMPSNTGLGLFEIVNLRGQNRLIESTDIVPHLIASLKQRAANHPPNATQQIWNLSHRNLSEREYQKRLRALKPYSIMLNSGKSTGESYATGRNTRYTTEFGIVRHTRVEHNLYVGRKEVAMAMMSELPPLNTPANQSQPFAETIHLQDGSTVIGTRNPVGVSIFATSDPNIFYAKQGEDFALVVGTVEQMAMYRLRTSTQEQKVWQ